MKNPKNTVAIFRKKIATLANSIDVRIKSAVFKPSEPKAILLFSRNLETACDLNEICASSTMSLL